MKTVGQLLRHSREQQGYTLSELSQKTKIDIKYLTALESDHYNRLPSSTFAKGFIRNVSLFLGLNPNDMVAIFRRDYQPNLPSHPKLIRHQLYRLPSTSIVYFAVAAVVFLLYLGYQFRAIIVPPPLQLIQPKNQTVLTSPIAIEGTTVVDATLTINNDLTVKPDPSGTFFTQISLSPGEQKLTVTSTNRFNRSTTRIIDITILSQ